MATFCDTQKETLCQKVVPKVGFFGLFWTKWVLINIFSFLSLLAILLFEIGSQGYEILLLDSFFFWHEFAQSEKLNKFG